MSNVEANKKMYINYTGTVTEGKLIDKLKVQSKQKEQFSKKLKALGLEYEKARKLRLKYRKTNEHDKYDVYVNKWAELKVKLEDWQTRMLRMNDDISNTVRKLIEWRSEHNVPIGF